MSSGRATSVMTQPGLTRMMSSTLCPAAEVAVTITSTSGKASDGTGRDVQVGTRIVPFDVLLELEQLGGLGRDEPQLVAGERQEAGAGRPDRPRGADHHRLAVEDAVVVDLGDAEPAHRLGGRPQRARGAVAVARGHRQRRLLRDGHAGVADDLGERAEAHDLGAETPGQLGGLEQARVGELGRVGEHLLRRPADGDQPALGLVAGVRDDAGDVAVDEWRDVGDRLLDHLGHPGDVRQESERLDVLEVLGRQRMDDECEAALAAVAAWPQQPGFELGVLNELGEVVGGELGVGGQGRRDHRLVHRRDDDEVERLRGDVDDEVGTEVARAWQAVPRRPCW